MNGGNVMSKNDEFDLNEALDGADVKPQKVPAKKAAKKIDPEDDRKNWPVIRIARVKGLPNFHYLSASGTRPGPMNSDGTPKTDAKDKPILGKPFNHELKVMRGVDVPVPPSIVNMLNSTFRTEYEQTYDPITGRGVLEASDVPPIPWQLVEKGKYIK